MSGEEEEKEEAMRRQFKQKQADYVQAIYTVKPGTLVELVQQYSTSLINPCVSYPVPTVPLYKRDASAGMRYYNVPAGSKFCVLNVHFYELNKQSAWTINRRIPAEDSNDAKNYDIELLSLEHHQPGSIFWKRVYRCFPVENYFSEKERAAAFNETYSELYTDTNTHLEKSFEDLFRIIWTP